MASASSETASQAAAASANPWWIWPLVLFVVTFLLGIAAVLGGVGGITVLCFVRIIPILLRKKDAVYGLFAIIEVLVLTFAASGFLKSGGH